LENKHIAKAATLPLPLDSEPASAFDEATEHRGDGQVLTRRRKVPWG